MKIQTNQLKPGMTILSDIIGPGGIVLIPANKVLSSEIITLLSRKGIAQVDVKENHSPTEKNTQQSQPPQSQPDQSVDPETARKQKLPALRLIISDDHMAATLIIEPTQQDNSDLIIEDILKVLSSNKITTGVNEHYVAAAVQNWNQKKRRYEIAEIATGVPPEPAVEGEIYILLRHLTLDKDIKKVRTSRYIWQNTDLGSQVQHVKPGMVVAEIQQGKPSIPGKNVNGELIFTEQVIRREITCGNGVTYSKDHRNFTSSVSGVLAFYNDTIEIIPVSFDGAVDIEIALNKMSADLIFHPPVDDGRLPLEKEIIDTIQSVHVLHGINNDSIKEVVSGLQNGKIPDQKVRIAQGTAPVNGQNGKITYHFNTQTSLKPKQNADGSVDYKSVDIVISVKKGDKLVTLEPPEKGIPGKNLYGEPIQCMDGVPAKMPIGPHTEVDPQHPDTLIASTNGIVRLVGPAVEVSEGFIINGDVDFSTGNVKYDHSVIVTGDVKSSFDIECGGDLQIGGTIEDSTLRVGGNVLCRFGFSGQSKGLIDAKGDVNLGFMKNQTIRSRKNVNIARESINSTIFAKESIHIHGNPLSVAGGYLTASESINVNSIGNHSGIKTLCEVGFDFTLGEDLHTLEGNLTELLQNHTKITENIKKIDKTLSFQKKLSIKDQAMRAKLKETLTKYDQQIQALELRKKIIEKKMYSFDKAFIKFERSAFPGTLFKFGERHFLVKEEIRGPKMVRLIDFEIKIL